MSDVIMPKMSDSMEEGKLIRWIKSEGDPVEKGEAIAEIETDKANVELEAPESGVLGRLFAAEGDVVPVGTAVAVIAQTEELAGAKGGASVAEPAVVERPSPPPIPEPHAAEQPKLKPEPEDTEGIKASPLAKKIAQDAGIDISKLRGTGPGGRIVEADVREFLGRGAKPAERPAPSPAPPAPRTTQPKPVEAPMMGERLRIGQIWKVVGRRMTESKQHAPHFYVTAETDMEEAVRLRGWMNSGRPDDRHISLNDIIVKACAVVLVDHPTLNASYVDEDHIEVHGSINVGIAIALSDGLVAPAVRDCEKKSLSVIAEEARGLIEKARAGKLTPEDYESGTFTISNLGMYGVDEFIAIVNPPQSAILAVGAVAPKPVVVEGHVEVRNRLRMTVSGDHRVTDGARVAEFLRDLRIVLEQPMRLVE